MGPMSVDAPIATRDAEAPAHAHGNAAHAVRNAIVLGGSLVATWSVALVVRLFLPRSLGPALFGEFNFADVLAANAFGFIGFGLDTYIQKEIHARPSHTSEFLGGLFLVRVLASAILFGALGWLLVATGRSPALLRTVFIFGLAQMASICAGTLATLLYVSQTVGRLALLNVTSKLLWGGGVGVALVMHASIEWFAVAFLLSETLRLLVLLRLVRSSLTLRIDLPNTWLVLRASAPFYATAVAAALYARIDVNIMGMLLPDKEVGFYGAAANVSGIAMLMAPLMSWVLMPQLAHAAVRSREELNAMFRRAIEGVLALAVPVSLMLALGADLIVTRLFGEKFLPAIGSLRVLSPMFVAVYLAMLAATHLNLTNRSWRVTSVTVGSLALNALLNLFLIHPAYRLLGEGGAGVVAAAISVACEVLVAATLLAMIGRTAWDRRSILCAVKSLGACGVVSVAHIAMSRLGPARLVVDLALYVAIIVSTGAVDVVELYNLVRSAARGRHVPA